MCCPPRAVCLARSVDPSSAGAVRASARPSPARLLGVHDVHPPITAVRAAVARALAEDLEPLGDLTAALLPPELTATAVFVPRHDGVLAGRRCVEQTVLQIDPSLQLDWSADDGDR